MKIVKQVNCIVRKVPGKLQSDSRVDKFSGNGIERERSPSGWESRGQAGKGSLQAMRSKEVVLSNVEEGRCRSFDSFGCFGPGSTQTSYCEEKHFNAQILKTSTIINSAQNYRLTFRESLSLPKRMNLFRN